MTRSITNWTPYGSGATATARPDLEYVHAEFERLCLAEIQAAIAGVIRHDEIMHRGAITAARRLV
jgi:hypothetical protein